MDPRDDGGPAFPAPYSESPNGMSIRDWMAGLAMQRMPFDPQFPTPIRDAEAAYYIADAMLAERKR